MTVANAPVLVSGVVQAEPGRHPVTEPAGTTRRGRFGGLAKYLGLAPFAVYVVIFLGVPTVLAVATGFFTEDGAFTLDNIAGLADPVVLATFASSFWVSAITAIVGSVVGALVCYALLGTRAGGTLRSLIDSASSVLAQFGGVMLAFAFIAAIGGQSLLTLWLKNTLGFDIYADGVWLYQPAGLLVVYTYFQVPL